MIERPTYDELKRRIQEDISHYNGCLPERVAIAWDGYIAALLEWGMISVDVHLQLHRLLPSIPYNPVTDIFRGRELF